MGLNDLVAKTMVTFRCVQEKCRSEHCPVSAQMQEVPGAGPGHLQSSVAELQSGLFCPLILILGQKLLYAVFRGLCCSPWECGKGDRESRNFFVPFPRCCRRS